MLGIDIQIYIYTYTYIRTWGGGGVLVLWGGHCIRLMQIPLGMPFQLQALLSATDQGQLLCNENMVLGGVLVLYYSSARIIKRKNEP